MVLVFRFKLNIPTWLLQGALRAYSWFSSCQFPFSAPAQKCVLWHGFLDPYAVPSRSCSPLALPIPSPQDLTLPSFCLDPWDRAVSGLGAVSCVKEVSASSRLSTKLRVALSVCLLHPCTVLLPLILSLPSIQFPRLSSVIQPRHLPRPGRTVWGRKEEKVDPTTPQAVRLSQLHHGQTHMLAVSPWWSVWIAHLLGTGPRERGTH